ncbi:MAG: hypothetical protein KGO83_05365, partial [Paenibacillaceae bacterium]|nr:hypothetical protein [Paenibacillaceae bacterium]
EQQCAYLEGQLLLFNLTDPHPKIEIMKFKSWDDVLSRFNKYFNHASLSSSQLKLYRFVRNIQLFIIKNKLVRNIQLSVIKNKKDIQDGAKIGIIIGIIINTLHVIFTGTEREKNFLAFVQKWIDSIMSNIQKLLPQQPTKRPEDQPTKRPVNQPKTKEPLRL